MTLVYALGIWQKLVYFHFFVSFTGNRSHLRRTNQKFEPSDETVRVIQESKIWKLENELYEFARDQFNFVKKHNLIYNKLRNYNVDVGNQFRYEKIYPKPWQELEERYFS